MALELALHEAKAQILFTRSGERTGVQNSLSNLVIKHYHFPKTMNNTPQTAQTITLNSKGRFTIKKRTLSGRNDYFKLEVPNTSILDLDLLINNNLALTLYSGKRNGSSLRRIKTSNKPRKQNESIDTALGAGTYFIQVHGPNKRYTLNVKARNIAPRQGIFNFVDPTEWGNGSESNLNSSIPAWTFGSGQVPSLEDLRTSDVISDFPFPNPDTGDPDEDRKILLNALKAVRDGRAENNYPSLEFDTSLLDGQAFKSLPFYIHGNYNEEKDDSGLFPGNDNNEIFTLEIQPDSPIRFSQETYVIERRWLQETGTHFTDVAEILGDGWFEVNEENYPEATLSWNLEAIFGEQPSSSSTLPITLLPSRQMGTI